MAALALNWALAQPGLTAIVVGPTRIEHLQPALDAVASTIEPEILDYLSELFS
jgi:aryl-alcohol dehydrogenase-like predicted oxidoreductase